MYFAGKNTISIICNLCLICRGVRSGTVQDVGHSLALQPKSFPPKQALRTFNIQNNTQKSEKTPKKTDISSGKLPPKKAVRGRGSALEVGGEATPEEPPRRHGLFGRAYAANYGNYLGEHFFPDAPGPKTPAENCPHHLGKLPQNAKRKTNTTPAYQIAAGHANDGPTSLASSGDRRTAAARRGMTGRTIVRDTRGRKEFFQAFFLCVWGAKKPKRKKVRKKIPPQNFYSYARRLLD